MSTASIGRMPAAAAAVAGQDEPNTLSKQQQQQAKLPSESPSFWEDIHRIRTNAFEYDNDVSAENEEKWSFRSRKSHILDTNGHYTWGRELNCYQLQNLPEEVFPNNTLEIVVSSNSSSSKEQPLSDSVYGLRIRFGALEGLRGWISLDANPIPTTDALDSAHWKFVAAQGQLPSSSNNNQQSVLLGASASAATCDESILSTSYDYAYTTTYKGGTDVIVESKDNKDESSSNNNNYHFLHPNSTSFVPKHNASANDVPVTKGQQVKVKVRKPKCKCKSDGGRAPLVPTSNNSIDSTNNKKAAPLSPSLSPQQIVPSLLPPTPQWVLEDAYTVDIEGMLRKAVVTATHKQKPFLFREDVDLWEDDLHDNGTAWLKARCFVCDEGWACLLRNFIRVDGVMCRVIDTRYIYKFGNTSSNSNKIYREHSWREGPWEPLVKAIQRDKQSEASRTTPAPASARPPQAVAASRMPPSARRAGPLPPPRVSIESINDSVAARYLPLKEPPTTESLSLEDFSSTGIQQKAYHHQQNQHQQQHQQLYVINNVEIEDGIPVPNSEVSDILGISFVLKRSKGTELEAISSSAASLWSKGYNSSSNSNSKSAQATILSVQISPDPTDGGRLAIGDDRGSVNIWRLSNGESLWHFDVAPRSILNRLETNPYFESEKLWVDYLVWSGDGTLVGAAAGKNAVLARAAATSNSKHTGNIVVASLESTSGTVTGLAFCKRAGQSPALAVASCGEVHWLAKQEEDELSLKTLKREGAAIECIDVSPDGKRVAVGFLDKTLRVFTVGTETENKDSIDDTTVSKENNNVVDWVGFSAAVKVVRFHRTGRWLAALGGNTILVIRDTLNPRSEPPIVCRTPGQTQADGNDGSCHKLEGIEWSGGDSNSKALLAALDATTKSIHLFSFSNITHGPSNVSRDAWPIQALPVMTVSPPFANPSPSVATRFAFGLDQNTTDFSQKQDDNGISVFVLRKINNNSELEQAFGSKLSIGNSEEPIHDASNEANPSEFSFCIV